MNIKSSYISKQDISNLICIEPKSILVNPKVKTVARVMLV